MNGLRQYMKTLFCSVGFILAAMLAACGGDQGRAPILGLPAAALASVTVTPATAAVPIGGVQQFTAMATYVDGASQDVTAASAWTSASASVAGVDGASGLATGVAAGSTAINASFGGKSASANLTVTAASLVSIAVLPANRSIAINGRQQFQAIGTFTDGSTRDMTAVSTFTSAAPAFATILGGGVATGVAAGNSVISASSGALSGSTNLTVTSATLSAIAVTPANGAIAAGARQQFTATATFSDASTSDVTIYSVWSTAAANVATVASPSGLATGVAQGAALISATFGGKSASQTLTVSAATVVSIALTPANASIPIGGVQQFTATATYSDASTSNVTASAAWTSASTGVATVLQNGVANGISGGSSLITATFGGKSNAQTLSVRAATLTSIAVSPVNAAIPVGDTQQFIATASYSDGTSGNVTASSSWTSGNLLVATVNNVSGVATGRSGGTSLITATYNGKSAAQTLTVNLALGPPAVILGSAGNFAILTKSGITDVPSSAITGNIGSSPISGAFIGVTCPEVAGVIYAVDAAGPACSVADPVLLSTAIGDMQTAYTDAAGRPSGVGPFLNVGAGTVSNQTLVAGTYTWGSDVTIATDLNLVGGPNDVWIFQITGKLHINPNMRVLLSGGAQAKNIFWQVTGAVSLDTHTHFEGSILAQTNIAMLTGASLNGRLLGQTAATLQQNAVTKPAP
ncbi:uncharacterized protein YjdB [Oxalobacteraceae bacterium GrIS 1.11]